MERKKIRIANIEDARRALEQAPERAVDEVTKREAIRALAGSISAAQKKGYTLDAIAELLGKSGIAISRVLLASYLSHPSENAGGKRKRKRKRSEERTLGASAERPQASSPTADVAGPGMGQVVETELESVDSATAAGPAQKRAGELGDAGFENRTAEGAVSKKTDPRITAETSKERRERNVSSARKSEFVPRKDSDDI